MHVHQGEGGRQPNLLEEEWEGVSMYVEDFKPEVVIARILLKRGCFLKTTGGEGLYLGWGRRTCLPHHDIWIV